MKFQFYKKGLSTVVATLLLVLLAIVLVGIIWTVVTNLVNDSTDKASSCLNIFEKVSLNDGYTCYNITSKELQFSINVKDVNLDKVLIGISAEASSKSIEIGVQATSSTLIRPYNGNYGDNFALPGENAGLTYVYNMTAAGFSGAPDAIRIIPVVNENQCEESDSILQIYNC